MIGHIPTDLLLAHARDLAAAGGPPVPESAREVTDLAVTGPVEIYAHTRAAAAQGTGSVLMSSGGTTGRPKLTHVPHGMGLERLLDFWRPLRPGDVLLNLFNAGRMWGSHYYMQTLAEKSHCTVIPSGPYSPEEVAGWLEMFEEVGVNALAGTPTGLADFAQGVLDAGTSIPALPVRTIIWMAEPWTGNKRDLVREAFPDAGLWGNYGSVETWVMAANQPGCDETTLHLLPSQIMEPDEDGALLSRVGDGWTVPVVRYRLGDRVAPATCRCGRPDALTVLGRADDSLTLRSALFKVSELIDLVREEPGVVEAQLRLTRSTDSARAASALTLDFTGTAAPEAVRARLTGEFYHLAAVARQYPDALRARRVSRLARIERTNKVPAMVWQESPANENPANERTEHERTEHDEKPHGDRKGENAA
ncbi:AMP-binding protein [Streptomyces sp. NPDC001339]|uniref:AMP-binding protein n=1 Tax=Streptomyces sp. NPDC001339 TaxID=3364563 RepID=UPI00367B3769